ncbi:hypothetical protein [Streptomyces scabiei]|uniref:hypothetical protein n=1 Tax=Streptomyces scabiei TaxID=1930 RepID=UPI0029BAAF61|nr:hypothetical protein [Streptomyces scabiei]MDX3202097.1 hypothetical protein [Streptomyces scabiei]MDX3217710.1 hypothetical protein [Streptomyces scabiei]
MTAPTDTGEHEPVPDEDVPTGSFGRAEYRLPEHLTPTPPEEQARHLADLDEALSTIRVGDALRRHARQPRRRVA